MPRACFFSNRLQAVASCGARLLARWIPSLTPSSWLNRSALNRLSIRCSLMVVPSIGSEWLSSTRVTTACDSARVRHTGQPAPTGDTDVMLLPELVDVSLAACQSSRSNINAELLAGRGQVFFGIIDLNVSFHQPTVRAFTV